MQSRHFGVLPTGEPVEAWTLSGSGGLVLEVIDYGGIVTKLFAPDRSGRTADVVLGFNDLASYLSGLAYFGAITGRVAGRITGARFHLADREYQLSRNEPPNHLHGGFRGFDKQLWKAVPAEDKGGAPALRLAHSSPDGAEGYPGTVSVAVTYTVTDENVFLIETEAVSNQPTPFNLTHHSYFNLAGEAAGSIADHQIQIHADEFALVDEHLTLRGGLQPVEGESNDFRASRGLGAAVPKLFQKHGDLYRLRKGSNTRRGTLSPAARLLHPGSGRVLEVSTTDSYLQFYTGVALDGSLIGKSGTRYERYAGLCLECEGYPDGANAPDLGDIILQAGQLSTQTTAYAFSAIAEGDPQ